MDTVKDVSVYAVLLVRVPGYSLAYAHMQLIFSRII